MIDRDEGPSRLRALGACSFSPPAFAPLLCQSQGAGDLSRSAEAPRGTPGKIIPEWWATSFRNDGQNYLGRGWATSFRKPGRLAPESATLDRLRAKPRRISRRSRPPAS